MNLFDLKQKLTDYFKGSAPDLDEQEAVLLEKATKLEELAQHYETEANLRKRIAAAEKRITASKSVSKTSGKGNGTFNIRGGRGGLIKVIVVVAIVVVVIVVLMSKAC